MATETKPDFRFDYKKYQSKQLTVEALDEHFKAINVPSVTVFGQIIALIKMAVFALYLWTRMKLVNEQERIEKQEYERSRNQEQRGDIAQDDLD